MRDALRRAGRYLAWVFLDDFGLPRIGWFMAVLAAIVAIGGLGIAYLASTRPEGYYCVRQPGHKPVEVYGRMYGPGESSCVSFYRSNANGGAFILTACAATTTGGRCAAEAQ